MKPMLASDYDESKLRFPLIVQPKIDGVRALNNNGRLTGRSLKEFKNKHVTTQFSILDYVGFDGELAAESETHPDLCRLTTSAVGTIEGEPYVLWWLFDYVRGVVATQPYETRYMELLQEIQYLQKMNPFLARHLRAVPSYKVTDLEMLRGKDEEFLKQGYEGTIIRDPNGLHKQGRSTIKEGGLLRIKQFIDAEAVVNDITEGESNQNEAKIGLLGQTERSSHQANMVPNGMVGNLICYAQKTVQLNGIPLITKGQQITVAAGKLTGEQRKFFWQNKDKIIGKVIKFQFFPKGIKDKPRFPTFQSFRDEADL